MTQENEKEKKKIEVFTAIVKENCYVVRDATIKITRILIRKLF